MTSIRHLLTLFDLSADELQSILTLAGDLKRDVSRGVRHPPCASRVLGLLFEKPSLRTRVSFEAAMAHLGGSSIFLGQDAGWGGREPVADFGRVLSEYVDLLVFRGHQHEVLLELAEHCGCPVINGLTPLAHPCQALADVLTIQELCGTGPGVKVAYIGDGNNVARSFALACAMTSIRLSIASPPSYELDSQFLQRVRTVCPAAELELTHDPQHAASDASAIYTDVWASMGQEAERAERIKHFAGFQVNSALMSAARPGAKFLHCLPARRGEEVTEEVIDGPGSVVVQQAANRLHAQKAILVWLLKGGNNETH